MKGMLVWPTNSADAVAATPVAFRTDVEIARGVDQQSDVIELIEAREHVLLQMRLLLIRVGDGLHSRVQMRQVKDSNTGACTKGRVS